MKTCIPFSYFILLNSSGFSSAFFAPSFLPAKDILRTSFRLYDQPSTKPELRIDENDDKFNNRLVNKPSAVSPKVGPEQQEQLYEINQLKKEKEQRETAINRLKFQLNELKTAVEESEDKRLEAEEEVEKLVKDSEAIKSEQKDQYDELQATLSEEKENSEEKLRLTLDELDQVKLDSLQKLEKAQEDAEDEKRQMMEEINNLQVALTETNDMISDAKKEMNSISNSSTIEGERQAIAIVEKEEEIKKLVKLKNDFEDEIQSLKMECNILKIALKESEEQTVKVQKNIDTLKMESEFSRKVNRDTIAQMKERFSMEKEDLSSQVGSLSEQLSKAKYDSEQELSVIKKEISEEKERLETEVNSLQTELNVATDRIERAKKSVYEVRKAADAKVSQIQEETKAYKNTMRNISTAEKSAMIKKIWDLESKIEKAKYNLIMKERETKALKAAAVNFEDQIKALEEAHEGNMFQLGQKLIAEEMFYVKSKSASRKRTRGLVAKFQKRLKRRETKSIISIEAARQELENLFQIGTQTTHEKDVTLDEKRVELSTAISSAYEKMEVTKKDFELRVLELENSLTDTKNRARSDLRQKVRDYERKLKTERNEAKISNAQLLSEKNAQIKNVERKGIENTRVVKLDLTEKLNESKNERDILQKSVEEKIKMIEAYEDERRSFRKLAKLIWKATKAKIPFRRKKAAKIQKEPNYSMKRTTE